MPKFLKKPENVECLEFEDASFETKVTGKPKPEVSWYRGDVRLEPSERVVYEEQEVDNVYTLRMKAVKKEEGAMYTVKATNDQGTMSASARLKVTRKLRPVFLFLWLQLFPTSLLFFEIQEIKGDVHSESKQ